MVNDLQSKTIAEERRISNKFASLQEDIADQRLVGKMKKEGHGCEKADEALDEHSRHMADVIEEGDRLRMKTLKAIVNLLVSLQIFSPNLLYISPIFCAVNCSAPD